jgi:formylglycine-generating enzyme required for sulfatase activity
MNARLAACVALALVAGAATVPVSTRQLRLRQGYVGQAAAAPAAPAIDPKELAVVEKLRERILAKAKASAGPAKAYTMTVPNTTATFDMAPIPAGTFDMGSADAAAPADQKPVHKVTLDAFWMMTTEVNWDAYLMFMFADQANERDKPDALVDGLSRPTAPHLEMSFGRGNAGFPAISMTAHAANKYAQWLSARTGEFYRVPTEAEWEYACRAGGQASVPEAQLGDVAWYQANSPTNDFKDGSYHKLGTKKPNAWGLYDMLGNVMEWTADQYVPYTAAAATNPWTKPTTSYPIAVRGGSWNDPANRVNCTIRYKSDAVWKERDPQLPTSVWYMTDAEWLGFRLVRPSKVPSAEEMYRSWNNGVEVDPY